MGGGTRCMDVFWILKYINVLEIYSKPDKKGIKSRQKNKGINSMNKFTSMILKTSTKQTLSCKNITVKMTQEETEILSRPRAITKMQCLL